MPNIFFYMSKQNVGYEDISLFQNLDYWRHFIISYSLAGEIWLFIRCSRSSTLICQWKLFITRFCLVLIGTHQKNIQNRPVVQKMCLCKQKNTNRQTKIFKNHKFVSNYNIYISQSLSNYFVNILKVQIHFLPDCKRRVMFPHVPISYVITVLSSYIKCL